MVEPLGEAAARRAGGRRAPAGCRRSADACFCDDIVGADARVEVVRPARDADDDDVRVGGGALRGRPQPAQAATQQREADRARPASRARRPSSARPAASAPRAASCDRCRARRAAREARSSGGRRLEQPELLLRLARRAADRRPAAARQLVALERRENLARALDDRRRQAGEPRHLDAVAAVRSARARSCAGR